jgi:hypothetical protein
MNLRPLTTVEELVGLPVEHPRVPELAMLCVCGHDLGDHMAEAPHACEPCEENRNEDPYWEGCLAFESARVVKAVP